MYVGSKIGAKSGHSAPLLAVKWRRKVRYNYCPKSQSPGNNLVADYVQLRKRQGPEEDFDERKEDPESSPDLGTSGLETQLGGGALPDKIIREREEGFQME